MTKRKQRTDFSRKRYTPDIRANALRLVREGQTVDNVSTALDIPTNTIHSWLREASVEDTTPALMSVSVAAKRLSLTERTIYRLIESGDLERVKVGKSVRLRCADVERIIASGVP